MDEFAADMKDGSFDAILLAVTGNKNDKRSSDNDSQGDDLGGESDIEEVEDEGLDEEEDDDDNEEEDEYGLGGDDDDEDEDYASKKQSKSTSRNKSSSTRNNSKSKKSTTNPRYANRTSKTKSKRSSKPKQQDDNDDIKNKNNNNNSNNNGKNKNHNNNSNNNNSKRNNERYGGNEEVDEDAVFTFKYDENGYGDAADAEMLSRMNEVDREKILTERGEERAAAELLWKEKRRLKATGDISRIDSSRSRGNSGGGGGGRSFREDDEDDDNRGRHRDDDDDDDMDIGDDMDDDDDNDDDDDDDDDRRGKYEDRRSSRSSGRAKSSKKSEALDALAQDRRKKASIDMGSDDDSDGDGDGDGDRRLEKRRDGRRRRRGDDDYDNESGEDDDDEGDEDEDENELGENEVVKKGEKRGGIGGSGKAEEDLLKEEEGPELCYKDIVSTGVSTTATTTALFLRRDFLIQLSQQPYFGRVIQGLYVRPRIGDKKNEACYLLCRIAGIQKGNVYELMGTDGLKSNQYLLLQSGKQRRMFQINLVSSSHPTEHEFNTYVDRARSGGIEVPRRDEVRKLLKDATKYLYDRNIICTDEENKKHMVNMEIIYPARVNWTRKRTEIEIELEIKKQNLTNLLRLQKNNKNNKNNNNNNNSNNNSNIKKIGDEIEGMYKKVEDIRKMETKYVFHGKKTNAEVFQSIAERNQKLNATNESLAASRRNYESNRTSIDLYSRFDATGQSYFSIGKDDDKNSGPLSEQAKDIYTGFDWRKYLLSWQPDCKKRKINNVNDKHQVIDKDYDIELPGLHDFVIDYSIPIQMKKPVSMLPPGLDAVYGQRIQKLNHANATTKTPKGARILSFTEWSTQRAS